MIAELIKLSKELYELDMVPESLGIDEMIEKLYGSGFGDQIEPDCNYRESEEDSSNSFSESFRTLAANKEFIKNLAGIINEYCEDDDIHRLKILLGEHSE